MSNVPSLGDKLTPQIPTSPGVNEHPNLLLVRRCPTQCLVQLPLCRSILIPGRIKLIMQVWGPKSIRLGFSGGALATSISYSLNVRLTAPEAGAILISVRILLHLGNDVRTQRGSIPFQAISCVLQARHSHLPWSSRNYNGFFRMVGLGGLCACRIDAWTRLSRCPIMSTFDY